jgi:phosphate transport system protein
VWEQESAMSIQRRFDEELADLKEKILRMGSLVEGQIRQALQALIDRDDDLATQVIENDRQVNTMDVAVDEACLALLALQQPAARDLRFITTAMKISTELERMSDLAENICERAIELHEEPQLKP